MLNRVIAGFSVFIFSLYSFSMEQYEKKKRPNKYLNPAKLESINNTGDIRVRCYDNSVFKVCPNPFDINRITTIQAEYERGSYISYRDYYISVDNFMNCSNWND